MNERKPICRMCDAPPRWMKCSDGDYQICLNRKCILFGIDEVAFFPIDDRFYEGDGERWLSPKNPKQ